MVGTQQHPSRPLQGILSGRRLTHHHQLFPLALSMVGHPLCRYSNCDFFPTLAYIIHYQKYLLFFLLLNGCGACPYRPILLAWQASMHGQGIAEKRPAQRFLRIQAFKKASKSLDWGLASFLASGLYRNLTVLKLPSQLGWQ